MKNNLKEIARKLGLRIVVSNWDQYENQAWLKPFLLAEEKERDRRSFERRIREAHIGQFKPMSESEFDWTWPTKIDRELVEELFNLDFLQEKSNVVLVGNNGVGKTMIAQNLAYAALMTGVHTRFVKASEMLNELIECDGSMARRRCLRKYCTVGLLVIDEVGYMDYDNRFADLLYEVVAGRYEKSVTILTTNKSFKQWGTIFPNAACVVTLVDRLLHKAEMVVIEGQSYRHKEATERAAAKQNARTKKTQKKPSRRA
jgi:DNA replication protein DnaC